MFKQGIYMGIDIGGSWIKAVGVKMDSTITIKDVPHLVKSSLKFKVKSRLRNNGSVDDFILALGELFNQMKTSQPILGIGISTAGVVDYKGEAVTVAAGHLTVLKDANWRKYLSERFNAPVTLINDANATAIGAAAEGYLKGLHTIGIMPIGTGLGFTIWRNGRRWEPNHLLPLLGSIDTPIGSFDQVAGVSALAEKTNNNLSLIFTSSQFEQEKTTYIENLSKVIYSACMIYHTDVILIGGGLAEAVKSEQNNVERSLEDKVNTSLAIFNKTVRIKIMPEGNTLPLIGAVLLAMGESIVQKENSTISYKNIRTERPYEKSLPLHRLNAESLVEKFYEAEQYSGNQLEESLSDISEVAATLTEKLNKGGRLIYVGAGTSGRLAAIDTVELACTFGFPRDRVYTLISGGLPDAAIEIEANFEEDASAVPELLLTSLNKNDVVIGISVSGYAHYVLSALALSKEIGAYTVLIQECSDTNVSFCDKIIALNSGLEIIAGSTRMKAGTATKKVLNFISTTAMVLLGKVYGPYMIEMECINQKLIHRAQNILYNLFGLDEKESYAILKENRFDLKTTILKLSDKHNGIKTNNN